tara:strand:- start:4406 stop:4588 length:183 start_codon:yes stop_codon:yes gene_type:complete
MSRIRHALNKLNKRLRTRTPTQEEAYLANSTCLASLEHRQRNLQRGNAPFQKAAMARFLP